MGVRKSSGKVVKSVCGEAEVFRERESGRRVKNREMGMWMGRLKTVMVGLVRGWE